MKFLPAKSFTISSTPYAYMGIQTQWMAEILLDICIHSERYIHVWKDPKDSPGKTRA